MKVMKFGGSSIAGVDGMNRTAEIIRSALGEKLVIVISASGKTTRHLLKCYDDLLNKKSNNAFSRLNNIEEEHIMLISNLIYDICIFYNVSTRVNQLIKDIRSDFEKIIEDGDSRLLKAKILSYGELLSSEILSAYLSYLNIGNKLVDARNVIITNENHLNAAPDLEAIRSKAESIIKPVVDSGAIAIAQGFIGSDKNGNTTLLGFEGSDYTASILANALDANEIYIWTDVDGVLTADPKFIDDTVIVENLSYDEASELAFSGAKVLHPLTMQPASIKNIPIFIRNSKNISCKGTCINRKGDIESYAIKSITFKDSVDLHEIKNFNLYNGNGKNNLELYNGNGNGSSSIHSNGGSEKVSSDNHFIQYSLITLVGKYIQKDPKIRKDLIAYKKKYNAKIIYPDSLNRINILIDKSICCEVLTRLHEEFIKKVISISRNKKSDYKRVFAG
jgi:aspartate kinase